MAGNRPSDPEAIGVDPAVSETSSRADDGQGPTPDSMGPDAGVCGLLAMLRDELGFDTASLFRPSSHGEHWTLVERVGPVRPWHAVLDPNLIAALEEDAVYADARSMPGVGVRLAGLGCGSIAVRSVPDGGRVVCDRTSPLSENERRWVEAATVPGPDGFGPTEDRPKHDTMPPDLAAAIQRLIETPGCSTPDALAAARDVLGANRIALLLDDEGEQEQPHVVYPADELGQEIIPAPIRAILRNLPPAGPLAPEVAERLAAALDFTHHTLHAARCCHAGRRHVLLAAWDRPTRVSPDSFDLAARLVGIARAAFVDRTERLERHLAAERVRWAHDIHDGITQAVTSAVIALENMRETIDGDDQAMGVIEGIQEDIRTSLSELRETMLELSDGVRPRRVPSRPIEQLIEDIAQRWRLPARVTVDEGVQGLSVEVQTVALLVVREALTNAAKHAAAPSVSVRVRAEQDGVAVEISDTGRGFEPEVPGRPSRGTQLGLRMMRERVSGVGGRLDVSSAPGEGTRIAVFLPTTPNGDAPGDQAPGARR